MISSVKVVNKDSSMPVSRMAEMAGRGHTPPDTDSSSVESPSVGCGRVGLGRMRPSMGREERAGRLTQAYSGPQSHKTRREVSVNQASAQKTAARCGESRRTPRAADFPLGFPHSIAVLRS